MEIAVPLDDRGLLLGDGLFETILADQGRLASFDAHRARLERGCSMLGLPAPDPDQFRAAAEQALQSAGLEQARAAVRLSWTAGSGGRGLDRPSEPAPRLLAAAAPAPRPTTPATLATVTICRNQSSPSSRLKSLAYLDNVLARRAAIAAGAEEALMLNAAGDVACAAAANIFWIDRDRLFTPTLACGVLDGIMRARVLTYAADLGAPSFQVSEAPSALARADAIFITNSLIGVRPISRLDDRLIADHPLVARLADACAEIA